MELHVQAQLTPLSADKTNEKRILYAIGQISQTMVLTKMSRGMGQRVKKIIQQKKHICGPCHHHHRHVTSSYSTHKKRKRDCIIISARGRRTQTQTRTLSIA
jgi:hypothetical protein